MSDATFTVQIQGTVTEEDSNAAKLLVEQENARRAEQDPPGEPLPTEPTGALATSYEWCLENNVLPPAHASYIEQAAAAAAQQQSVEDLWKGATNAGRQAAVDALEANQQP